MSSPQDLNAVHPRSSLVSVAWNHPPSTVPRSLSVTVFVCSRCEWICVLMKDSIRDDQAGGKPWPLSHYQSQPFPWVLVSEMPNNTGHSKQWVIQILLSGAVNGVWMQGSGYITFIFMRISTNFRFFLFHLYLDRMILHCKNSEINFHEKHPSTKLVKKIRIICKNTNKYFKQFI